MENYHFLNAIETNDRLSATDLLRIGNKYRKAQGLRPKTTGEYNRLDSTKQFKKALSNKCTKDIMYISATSKTLWVHPLLLIDMALWLNPNNTPEKTKGVNPEMKLKIYGLFLGGLLAQRNSNFDIFHKICDFVHDDTLNIVTKE